MIQILTQFKYIGFALLFFYQLQAQNSPVAGTIRGRVVDKETKIALRSATVELLGFSPAKTTELNPENGEFEFDNIPLGRYRLQARSPKHENATYNDLNVVGGREVFVTIEIRERVDGGRKDPFKNTDIISKGGSGLSPNVLKQEVLLMENTIGEQQFDHDKLNRFSGGRNDVARLVASYAGIANSNDSRNDLVVRGASPLGLQWLVEGIPVQNPNHVANLGATAGFFPILNINAVDKSDFRMGSFSAQYANSTAGIFDIRLRHSNYLKTAITAQLSINGAELMLEAPFARKKASIVVAARYSLVRFMGQLPQLFNFGAQTLPYAKDINWKLHRRWRKAESSFFGFYGDSYYESFPQQRDTNSVFLNDPDAYTLWQNRSMLSGGYLRYFFNDKTYLRAAVGANATWCDIQKRFYYQPNDTSAGAYNGLKSKNLQLTYSANVYANRKFNSRLSSRLGFLLQHTSYELYELENRYNFFPVTNYDYIGTGYLLHIYTQNEYRISNKLNIQAGIVGLYASIHRRMVAEPRLNMSWFINNRHQINAAYTLQHQTLNPSLYFYQRSSFDAVSGSSSFDVSNRNLGFIGNHYTMIEYLYQLSTCWQFKLSPYYRAWFGLPIQADAGSSYSFYNSDGNLGYPLPSFPLVSEGKGYNYGLDLTINHFFHNGWQLLASGSYFQSKYRGSDGQLRDSRFNRNYIGKLLLCKEWTLSGSKRSIFFASTTFTYAGGERFTPIDLNQSQIFNNEVFSPDAYGQQIADYLRWDAKIGFRFNRKKSNHYLYFDVMNLTEHKNVFTYRYDSSSRSIKPVYQYGRLIEFFYRVQF